MRVLVFGMACDKLAGIETFLLSMNKNMDGDCVFDYVVNGRNCIHQKAVTDNGGRIFEITQYAENPVKNFIELISVIRDSRDTHPVAYFNLFSMVHVIPVVLCKLFGYNIVLHAHNSNIKNKNKLYRLLHTANRRIFSHISCKRLTCASHAAEFMFGKSHSAEMVYNAVDTNRFLFRVQDRKEIRARYNIGDKYVVGFVGRLSAQKNPLFVIEIFEKLHAMDGNTVLMMIGEGELKEDVQISIRKKGLVDSVLILGNQRAIEKYYSAMDVFILPSLFEGLPVVLAETQASGLTSFVTKEAVTEESCIAEGMVEYISREMNAQAWANRILARKGKSYDRTACNEIVKQSNFNIHKEAMRLEMILKKLA